MDPCLKATSPSDNCCHLAVAADDNSTNGSIVCRQAAAALTPAYNGSDVVTDDETAGARHWPILFLFVLVAAGVTGNGLVCCAVVVERKLRNVTNYFLVSLSVADLLVSLVVMPCCIAHDFFGYWPFGLIMCDFWQIADVTLCTSSIMHMCTISLDRYAALRRPLESRCGRRSTISRVRTRIAVVWLLSFAVASPLIAIGVVAPTDLLDARRQCAIFNGDFLVYGSLVAFFGPLVVMLITYALTIRLLRDRAAEAERRSLDGTLRRSTSAHRRRRTGAPSTGGYSALGSQTILQTIQPLDRADVTPTASDDVTDDNVVDAAAAASAAETPSSTMSNTSHHRTSTTVDGLFSSTRRRLSSRRLSTTGAGLLWRLRHRASLRRRLLAETVAMRVTGPVVGGRVGATGSDTDSDGTTPSTRQVRAASLIGGPMMVRTERKAVIVVGMMFTLFVACWASFFVVNLAMGVCQSCVFDERLFKSFQWLGYASSTVNPIIYTVFNKQFKMTFVRLLTCNRTFSATTGSRQASTAGWSGSTSQRTGVKRMISYS